MQPLEIGGASFVCLAVIGITITKAWRSWKNDRDVTLNDSLTEIMTTTTSVGIDNDKDRLIAVENGSVQI